MKIVTLIASMMLIAGIASANDPHAAPATTPAATAEGSMAPTGEVKKDEAAPVAKKAHKKDKKSHKDTEVKK